MSLLGLNDIQYPTTQTGYTTSSQSVTNPFAMSFGNPFMPTASAFPMGTSLFVNPDFDIPMMPMYSTSSYDFMLKSTPSLFDLTLSPSNNNSGSKKKSSVSLSSGNIGKDIVATARQYIGYNEKDGSYKLFTNGRKEAWCADFATYVTKEALRANGKSIPSGFGSSSVAGLKSWGQKNGRYVTNVSQAKPGDIVIFNRSHTGIVKNILADGTVVTIEGNTSDKVAERKYSPSSGKINGFVQVA